jgi:hypothetical protein
MRLASRKTVCSEKSGVCDEVNMSVRSWFESPESPDYERTVSNLKDGAVHRLKAEQKSRSRQAANQAVTKSSDDVSRRQASTGKVGFEAWPLPGLAPMTRVRTSFGDVHAAALRKGDEVLTRRGKYLPILWLTRICLDEDILRAKPDCNPVVLAAGALGPQLPSNEIMLSPRQVICADTKGSLSANREAAMLVSWPGIRRLRETGLSYTMFHVGEAAEIYCEGTYLLFPMDA